MKLFKTTGLFVAAAMIAVACGPSDNVETREAQEVTDGSGSTLTVDASTSRINWRGYKPTGQHYGHIPMAEGEVMVEGESLTGARFVFDITSLEIEDLEKGSENYGKLRGHLQSEDFFDANNHPKAVFELTGVEPFGSENIDNKDEFETENTPRSDSDIAPSNPTHWISGNLTMRGTTKNVKFPATVSVNDGAVAAKAGFNIDRTEWGLSYGDESTAADKARDQFIYNTVSVEFDIKAN